MRAWARHTTAGLLEQQRWREYYATLDDPTLAVLVDRLLCRTPRDALRLVRPLRLSWQSRFGTPRVVRAFVLAAAMSLCQAAWLVPCARCRKRSVLREALAPMYCGHCRKPLVRVPTLPAELIFHHLREPLRQGALADTADYEDIEDLRITIFYVPPRCAGLLFPRSLSAQIRLRARQVSASAADGHGSEVSLNLLLQPDGPKRLSIDPVSYAAGSAVVGKGCPLVVRNGHASLPLDVRLMPIRDEGRIGEDHLRAVEEKADLFG